MGVVYATDAASVAGQVEIIAEAPAEALKTPVLYRVGLTEDEERLRRKQPPRKPFLAYLQSDEAADVFREYGFAICSGDEETSAGEDGTRQRQKRKLPKQVQRLCLRQGMQNDRISSGYKLVAFMDLA